MSVKRGGRRAESLQHQAEHTRPRRAPLASYLVILFAAAFLLLLMAHFQQQRQNAETTDALRQSNSAVDAIQAMMEDNDELRAENEALKAQVEELEQELSDARELAGMIEARAQGQESAAAAMDYFWQIDEAYVLGRYRLCRELIQELKDSGYEGALPNSKATDNDRFSPLARYNEICEALY